MNEDAILFLRDGDHKRTTSTLLTAFACLDSFKVSQTYFPERNCRKRLAPISSIEIPEDPMNEKAVVNAGNDLFTCYNRALMVPEMDNFSACYESNTRMSAILQYNLALAHHCAGIEKNSATELTTALQLYEGAYFTIERVKDLVHMEDVFALLLAIFFNMTHIHCNSFNIIECEHCMDWMKVALKSRECVTLAEDDYLFFSTNISLLSIQMPRLAPAA